MASVGVCFSPGLPGSLLGGGILKMVISIVVLQTSKKMCSASILLQYFLLKNLTKNFKVDFSVSLKVILTLLCSAAKILTSLATLFSMPCGARRICSSPEQNSSFSAKHCQRQLRGMTLGIAAAPEF
jgi:hypothetical protein